MSYKWIRLSGIICNYLFLFLGPAWYSVKVYELQNFAFTVYCANGVLQQFAARVLGSISIILRSRGFKFNDEIG